MSRCTLFLGHKFEVESGGMIKCTRCLRKWNPYEGGREVVPYGYRSWTAWRDECMANGSLPIYAPPSGFSEDDSNRLSENEIRSILDRRRRY